MRTIHAPDAPKVVGPYSHAIVEGNLVFCAGQIGIDPKTSELAGDTIASQTEQTLKNIKAVLEAAGTSLEKVVQTSCYLTTMDDYAAFNEACAAVFSVHKPARTTVAVAALPRSARVEIAVVATL